MRPREARILRESPLEERPRPLVHVADGTAHQSDARSEEGVGIGACGQRPRVRKAPPHVGIEAGRNAVRQPDRRLADRAGGDVQPFRPELVALAGGREGKGYGQPAPDPPGRAGDEMARVEPTRRLLGGNVLRPELEGRVPRRHRQKAEAAEVLRQFLGQPVGDQPVPGVGRVCGKGQHHHARRRRLRGRRRWFQRVAASRHGADDALAEHAADIADGPGQRVLRDRQARSGRVEQHVLVEDLPGPGSHEAEEREAPRTQVHGSAFAQPHAAVGVEAVVAGADAGHGAAPSRGFPRRLLRSGDPVNCLRGAAAARAIPAGCRPTTGRGRARAARGDPGTPTPGRRGRSRR